MLAGIDLGLRLYEHGAALCARLSGLESGRVFLALYNK
jgi:hypothetical protein